MFYRRDTTNASGIFGVWNVFIIMCVTDVQHYILNRKKTKTTFTTYIITHKRKHNKQKQKLWQKVCFKSARKQTRFTETCKPHWKTSNARKLFFSEHCHLFYFRSNWHGANWHDMKVYSLTSSTTFFTSRFTTRCSSSTGTRATVGNFDFFLFGLLRFSVLLLFCRLRIRVRRTCSTSRCSTTWCSSHLWLFSLRDECVLYFRFVKVYGKKI